LTRAGGLQFGDILERWLRDRPRGGTRSGLFLCAEGDDMISDNRDERRKHGDAMRTLRNSPSHDAVMRALEHLTDNWESFGGATVGSAVAAMVSRAVTAGPSAIREKCVAALDALYPDLPEGVRAGARRVAAIDDSSPALREFLRVTLPGVDPDCPEVVSQLRRAYHRQQEMNARRSAMQATLFLNRHVLGEEPDRAERFWWFARIVVGGVIETELKQLGESPTREICEAHAREFLSALGIGLAGVLEANWSSAECDYAEEVEPDRVGDGCPILGRSRVVRPRGKPGTRVEDLRANLGG